MVSAVSHSSAIFARRLILAAAGCCGLVLTVGSWGGGLDAAAVEGPAPGQVCARMVRTTERAIVWTTRRDRVLFFYFATFEPDGEPRIKPVLIGTGGQVESSCGLAYRDGHYAAALPHYDDVFGHEGELTFAKLDPRTGHAGGRRVLDSTKGGDEHTVESLAPSDRGYTLRFHTTENPRSRQFDLDPQGDMLEDSIP